ncbi:MAG: glycolate oxidase subunit GlcE [Betaproteobacteria bacterium]|nr:glycolate oxidase subunit GlcE [Betaproteobacteria bacterium]
MNAHCQDADQSHLLLEQVQAALTNAAPVQITAGNSKHFFGRPASGIPLDTRGHCGIVSYDPSELVITARAGTPLAEIESALAAAGQILPFEPPDFSGTATIGGTVAAGLSGPRRPWAGSVRDYVLGCRVITGQGKHLRFGGQVIKNVAGYDVSRLMSGSLGCLGLITEVSLKVLPKPRTILTLRLDIGRLEALRVFPEWGRQPLPITAAAHDENTVLLRLEGGEGSVRDARQKLGGQETSSDFWAALRDHRLPFFADPRPLWRLSVSSHRSPLNLPGASIVDWGGAQIWLKSSAPADEIRQLARTAGGHASCFTPGIDDSPLMPLPAALLRIHQQVKAQLDPRGIFNPGRMYADI